jgi:hypothetical protein
MVGIRRDDVDVVSAIAFPGWTTIRLWNSHVSAASGDGLLILLRPNCLYGVISLACNCILWRNMSRDLSWGA